MRRCSPVEMFSGCAGPVFIVAIDPWNAVATGASVIVAIQRAKLTSSRSSTSASSSRIMALEISRTSRNSSGLIHANRSPRTMGKSVPSWSHQAPTFGRISISAPHSRATCETRSMSEPAIPCSPSSKW
ncbi:unannotated protein [freshwater metagenome]|uniref:Unannotated protein n=1 Tax=freshwater metagenome TaxID=449393 RepID=A0A6J7DNP9_9ZZZZ